VVAMIWEDAIKHIYPDIIPNKDFFIQYDGSVFFISVWNYKEREPTEEELTEAWNDLQIHPEIKPKTEIDILKEDLVVAREENAQNNLAIIDLWEMLINGGIV
jgi:hypothetical protein